MEIIAKIKNIIGSYLGKKPKSKISTSVTKTTISNNNVPKVFDLYLGSMDPIFGTESALFEAISSYYDGSVKLSIIGPTLNVACECSVVIFIAFATKDGEDISNKIQWSGGDDPSTGEGSMYGTKFILTGDRIVTATVDGVFDFKTIKIEDHFDPIEVIPTVTVKEWSEDTGDENWGRVRFEPANYEDRVSCDITEWRYLVMKIGYDLYPSASLKAPWGLVEEPNPVVGGNTTEQNWHAQISDLATLGDKYGISWYSLAAIKAHEQYHINQFDSFIKKEWERMKPELENLYVGIVDYPNKEEAKKVLFSYAKPIFDHSVLNWNLYMSLNEEAAKLLGAKPVIDALIKKIEDFAKSQGWE